MWWRDRWQCLTTYHGRKTGRIQGTTDGTTAIVEDMCVNPRGLHVLVPQQFLGVITTGPHPLRWRRRCGTGTHPTFRPYAGVYTNRSRVTLGQLTVQDGTSNRLLCGETCGTRWDGSAPNSFDLAWMAAGGLGTYLGLHRARDADLIAFSSPHVAGVQFCFAAGRCGPCAMGRHGGAVAAPSPPIGSSSINAPAATTAGAPMPTSSWIDPVIGHPCLGRHEVSRMQTGCFAPRYATALAVVCPFG